MTTPPVTLHGGERLTIQDAADTAAQVLAALEGSPSGLRLDLTDVRELDTAGLQVLLWAAREADAREVTLEVTVSPDVTDVLTLVGLDGPALRTGGAR